MNNELSAALSAIRSVNCKLVSFSLKELWHIHSLSMTGFPPPWPNTWHSIANKKIYFLEITMAFDNVSRKLYFSIGHRYLVHSSSDVEWILHYQGKLDHWIVSRCWGNACRRFCHRVCTRNLWYRDPVLRIVQNCARRVMRKKCDRCDVLQGL